MKKKKETKQNKKAIQKKMFVLICEEIREKKIKRSEHFIFLS